MKIIEKEFNVVTGEETITERDETAQEKAEREKNHKKIKDEIAKNEAKEAARRGIADRLGLTTEELQVLLG